MSVKPRWLVPVLTVQLKTGPCSPSLPVSSSCAVSAACCARLATSRRVWEAARRAVFAAKLCGAPLTSSHPVRHVRLLSEWRAYGSGGAPKTDARAHEDSGIERKGEGSCSALSVLLIVGWRPLDGLKMPAPRIDHFVLIGTVTQWHISTSTHLAMAS